MSITNRKITVQGTKDIIELVGKLESDKKITTIALNINGIEHDNVKSKPTDSILGCNYELNGVLSDNVTVKATFKSHLFMKPKYSFYVEKQLIHKESGTWLGY